MGQRPKPFLSGEWYHCYNRGVDKRQIFMDENDYERFLMLLYAANNVEAVHISNFEHRSKSKTLTEVLRIKRKGRLVDLAAFNLMRTHTHFLLREFAQGGITSFMRKLGTAYTMYFNIRYERTGSLFQGAFKAKHISDDQYFNRIFSYIHSNHAEYVEPKWKQGIIRDEEALKKFLIEYRYSSLPEYCSLTRPESVLVNVDAVLETIDRLPDVRQVIEEGRIYARNDAEW